MNTMVSSCRVQLHNSSLLGLDDYGSATAVLPARVVLEHVVAPKASGPECWVTQCRVSDHEAAVKALTELGGTMVEVTPAAMCGEYYVRPFLVGPDEYRALLGYWRRLAQVKQYAKG